MGNTSKGEVAAFTHLLVLVLMRTWTHGLCYDDFDNLTMPANLLWTLMFLKKHITEEVSTTRAEVHEDVF